MKTFSFKTFFFY